MKVKKMMHRNVEWASPDTPVRTLAKKMRQYDIGAIPVGENDRLIGMVTDRDITVRGVANGKDVSKLTGRDVMTKGVIWCRDTDKAKSAARVMDSKRVRRLPVIDANSKQEDGRHACSWRHLSRSIAEDGSQTDQGSF